MAFLNKFIKKIKKSIDIIKMFDIIKV